MFDKLFNGNNEEIEKKVREIVLKNSELENRLIQSTLEVEQIKANLREVQLSVQLILNTYQGLAEEVGGLQDVLFALMNPTQKNGFRFSFRENGEDDDDDGNNWN